MQPISPTCEGLQFGSENNRQLQHVTGLILQLSFPTCTLHACAARIVANYVAMPMHHPAHPRTETEYMFAVKPIIISRSIHRQILHQWPHMNYE